MRVSSYGLVFTKCEAFRRLVIGLNLANITAFGNRHDHNSKMSRFIGL